MGKLRAQVMECDNPSCRTEPRITTKDDPAIGYYLGAGYYVEGWGGGPIPKAYACSLECVGPAIQAVIEAERS